MKTKNFSKWGIGITLSILLVIAGCFQLSEKNQKNIIAPEVEDPLSFIVDLTTIGDSLMGTKDMQESTALGAWWWDINQAIWNRAHQDIGNNVHLQCKPWVNAVDKDVTGFSLPSTQDNGFYLNSGHVMMIVDGNRVGGGTIESGIGVGNIIQMYIVSTTYLGPHTAIFYRYVTYNGVPGMYWIESNFLAPTTVYVRFVSFDWFRARVGTKYSIYQALNW